THVRPGRRRRVPAAAPRPRSQAGREPGEDVPGCRRVRGREWFGRSSRRCGRVREIGRSCERRRAGRPLCCGGDVTALVPERIEDVVAAVREHGLIIAHGARTKAPLVAHEAGAVYLDTTRLSGVVEYDPDEFTFTALAGTPLEEIQALLARHGQHLPFDPPLARAGATLGGTVAAGLNGSGRLRYGGIRDFIIGVRLVDGTGRLVRGGGKVVKNAAGFDVPKLVVGSLGRLGVLVELSFKVFPTPPAWRTIRIACDGVEDAVAVMAELGRRPFDLEALDFEPPGTLVVRASGEEATLDVHAARVGAATGRRIA